MARILIADDEESMRMLVARAIGMDGHHRPCQRIGRGEHVTPRGGIAAGRRRARVRQVIVHMAAHAIDLLRDRGRERTLSFGFRALRLLVEERERRFQSVREVAGLGQRARDSLLPIAQ